MLYLLKIWKDFTEWFTLLHGQTSSVYRKLTALSSADSWTHAKPTWMLLWIIILLLLLCWTNKDFILFIPLNVFNDIALCFDIFIQLRANQRLATEYLLKERLDSIAFAISIDRITLLILGQNATLCCLLLLKLKVPNFDVTHYRAVVVRCCFKLRLDLLASNKLDGNKCLLSSRPV